MLIKSLQTIIAMLVSTVMFAQGIHFETGTWAEVVEKAKKENKLIYLDVYAEWCGPCKMMAKNVFPHPQAGDKYNKHFINYKIDAEKGEGRTVARQYGVSAYPTNLYINPHNQKPVYRVAGACDVPEFIKRADIALHDFNDPMSWEEYKKKLKSNPQDLNFIQLYMEKAQRLGENYDDAINMYVEHHMTQPVTDSQLIFLLTHVQNLDNKGYQALSQYRAQADALVGDDRYKLIEREKTTLMNNTFKKAVEKGDLKVMYAAKPILFKYTPYDTTGKWLSIETLYYQTLKDEKNFHKSTLNTIKYYESLGQKIQTLNEKSFNDNINQLKSNPRLSQLNEEALNKEIKNQVLRNIAFKYPLTVNLINAYLTASDYVLNNSTNKKQLKSVITWLDKAEQNIPEENVDLTEKIYELKALYFVKQGNTAEAQKITEKRIDFLKSKKQSTKNAEETLKKIKDGTMAKTQ